MSSPAFTDLDLMRMVPDSAKSMNCRLRLDPAGADRGMVAEVTQADLLPPATSRVDADAPMVDAMTAGNRAAVPWQAAAPAPADLPRGVRSR